MWACHRDEGERAHPCKWWFGAGSFAFTPHDRPGATAINMAACHTVSCSLSDREPPPNKCNCIVPSRLSFCIEGWCAKRVERVLGLAVGSTGMVNWETAQRTDERDSVSGVRRSDGSSYSIQRVSGGQLP
jgi:hypothetical protein